VFGNPTQPDGIKADPILGDYARAIIRDRPLVYTRMVGRDVIRYFDPTDDSETGILDLPMLPAPVPPTHVATSERLLHDFEPTKRAPAGLLGAYAHVIHLPRPLLGVLSLVAALLLAAALIGGRRFALGHRSEALLLLGGGLSLLVGATATSDFVLRYMLPGIPILLCGIVLVLKDAAALRRGR
jgi:hypothetical protein